MVRKEVYGGCTTGQKVHAQSRAASGYVPAAQVDRSSQLTTFSTRDPRKAHETEPDGANFPAAQRPLTAVNPVAAQ